MSLKDEIDILDNAKTAVQNEIDRINAAKENIKTAIESKGVSVPSSEKIDTYASYIQAIETGGKVTSVNGMTGDVNVQTLFNIKFTYNDGIVNGSVSAKATKSRFTPNSGMEIGDSVSYTVYERVGNTGQQPVGLGIGKITEISGSNITVEPVYVFPFSTTQYYVTSENPNTVWPDVYPYKFYVTKEDEPMGSGYITFVVE